MIRRSWTRAASIEETLALWAASLREIKTRIRPLFRQERVATNAGLFWKACSEMSNAKLVGCAQRQLAILALGGNRRFSGRRDWDADGLRDIVCDYVIEHLADDDAVPGDRRDRLSQAGQGIVRSGAAIHWFCRQDHELPDRGFRCLRFAPRSCVRRSRAVSSKEWTDDPDRLEAAYVPPMSALRPNHSLRREWLHTPSPCLYHSSGLPAIRSTRCWRYRTATTPGGQRLCARGQQRSCISILGQAAIRRRQGPRTSPGRGARPTGNACRRGPEPKDRGCMIGAISNWPISRSKNLAAQIKAFGHAVC